MTRPSPFARHHASLTATRRVREQTGVRTRLLVLFGGILVAGCGPTDATTTVPSVARVEISVSRVSLYVGESAQAVATPRDQSGNALGEKVTWSSTDPTIATVSGSGVVFAIGNGTTTITATAGERSASVAINVSPAPQYIVGLSPTVAPILTAGDSLQFTAVVIDPHTGAVVDGAPVAWFATGNDGVSITPSGLVRIAAGGALGQGSAVIGASPPSGPPNSVVVHINDWNAYRPSAGQPLFAVKISALTGSASLTITCDPQTRSSQAYVLDLKFGYVPIPVAIRFSGDATANITTWTADDDLPIEYFPQDAKSIWTKAAARDTLYMTYNPGLTGAGTPDATFLTRGLRYYTSSYLGGCI